MSNGTTSKRNSTVVRPVTFNSLENEVQALVEELRSTYGLPKTLVRNILAYTKCLVVRDTDEIDEPIFTAQMVKWFEITDKNMLGRMYTVCKDPRLPSMSIADYSRTVCTLLCEDVEIQASYVFRVYDVNQDGSISTMELYQLLKPCVIQLENDDIDAEENVGDIVDIVIAATDLDRNRDISLDEYLALVKKDILLLQLLGKCLPSNVCAKSFIKRLTGPSPQMITLEYRDERKICLKELDFTIKKELYPFKLELP